MEDLLFEGYSLLQALLSCGDHGFRPDLLDDPL